MVRMVGIVLLLVAGGCAWPTRQERWQAERERTEALRLAMENRRRAQELAPLGRVWVTFRSWCDSAVTVWVATTTGEPKRLCELAPQLPYRTALGAGELEQLVCRRSDGAMVAYDYRRLHTGDYHVTVRH